MAAGIDEQREAAAASAESLKARGNDLLKVGKAVEAAGAYSQALEVDPSAKALWSNRSTARLKIGDAVGALADADEAARLDPAWAKAHLRRARALEALGKFVEASAACGQGDVAATNAKQQGEAREFQKLRAEFAGRAAEKLMLGWWHGTVSQTLGGYSQEFQFGVQGVPGALDCVVYENPLSGKYVLKDVEITENSGFRGGLDVSLQNPDGQVTDVAYLFKIGDGDDRLHLCCPMSSPMRPRTFDGAGYVAMSRGRERSADATEATEGERLLQYLDELQEIVELQDRHTRGGDGAAMAQYLQEDKALGDTVKIGELSAPETLEDKQNRMASQQKLTALGVKYPKNILDTAQRLIKGELKASDVCSAEPWELEKRVKSFQRRSAEVAESNEAENEAATQTDKRAESTPAAATAAKEETRAAATDVATTIASAPVTAAPAPLEPQRRQEPASTGSCWSGCFPFRN